MYTVFQCVQECELMELSIKKKLKQVLSQGLVYGLTSSLQSVLAFVLLPILTIHYTPEEFGIYSLVIVASAFASAVFFFGASSALGRFYFDEDSDDYRRSIISSALLVTSIGAILLIGLSIFLSRSVSLWIFKTPLYSYHLILAFTGAAFGFLVTTLTLILRYEKKTWIFLSVSIFSVLVNLGVTFILLVYYKAGILAPLYGTLSSNIICFGSLLYFQRKFISTHTKQHHIEKIFRFGIQASFAGLVYYLVDFIDRLIIDDVLNLSDVGIYSLGCRLASIINVLIVMPFTLVWAPIRMQYSKSKTSNTFMIKVSSFYILIGSVTVLFAVLFSKEIIAVFFSNKDYAEAAKVFPIVMLGLLIYGMQNIVDFGIYVSNKIYLYVVISLAGLVLNIVLNYWLLPKFGYIAASYITLLTYSLNTFLIYVVSSRFYKMNLENFRIFSLLSVLLIVYFLVNYLPEYFSAIGIKCFMFLSTIAFIYFFWINADEKQKLLHATENWRKKTVN